MTATRRELLLGLLGCAACGAGVGAGRSTESDGGAGASPDCTKPGAGTDRVYCLMSPLSVRVRGGASLGIGDAILVNVDDATAVILARDRLGFFARSAVCTHACCVVALCGDTDCSSLTPSPGACEMSAVVRMDLEGQALCPCHGSVFRLSDGMPITGPAKTSLPSYAVSFAGEDAWVNTATRVLARDRS